MNFYRQPDGDEKDEGGMLESPGVVGVIVHKDGVIPIGACKFSNSMRVIEIAPQTIGNSICYSTFRHMEMLYALAELGPLGPRAEPPPKATPKPPAAPPHSALRDRKKELRQIEHRKRLAKKGKRS